MCAGVRAQHRDGSLCVSSRRRQSERAAGALASAARTLPLAEGVVRVASGGDDDALPAHGPYDLLVAEPFYANVQAGLPWRGLVHFAYGHTR